MASESNLTVGTMNFGARIPAPEASAIVERALERGVTLFDTANIYGKGDSEKILGAALRGRGRVATKMGAMGEGLGSPRVLAAIDESLKRLGRDFVDLYDLHVPDPKTPFPETLEALSTAIDGCAVKLPPELRAKLDDVHRAYLGTDASYAR